MNHKDNFINFPHPMIKNIKELRELSNFMITQADFKTGEIVLASKDADISDSALLDEIVFLDATDRASVEFVDFANGEITVRWLPKGIKKARALNGWDITEEEIEMLQKKRKIDAIKSVRSRTNMGLTDAKNYVEKILETMNE